MKQKVAQRLILVAILLLSVALVLCMKEAVSADMTWEEFCEEYGEMPPAPPCEDNCDVWVDPGFPEPMGDYSDGGESIAPMNAAKFVSAIDWTGQATWQFS